MPSVIVPERLDASAVRKFAQQSRRPFVRPTASTDTAKAPDKAMVINVTPADSLYTQTPITSFTIITRKYHSDSVIRGNGRQFRDPCMF